MEEAKQEAKQVKCLNELEIYKEILKRIEYKRPASCKRMGEHLKSLELPSTNYYLIKKFVEGEELYPDRNKPMGEEKMIALMKKLGMKFINPAYIIEM